MGLLPHRVESGTLPVELLLNYSDVSGDVVFTDCFYLGCHSRTRVLVDGCAKPDFYGNSTDQWYLQPANPYSASMMMTASQFAAYLVGPMWDYVSACRRSPWGVGETAASGLIWDPRYGQSASVTHLKMRVVHLSPMRDFGSYRSMHRRKHLAVDTARHWISQCANSTGLCGSFGSSSRPSVTSTWPIAHCDENRAKQLSRGTQ